MVTLWDLSLQVAAELKLQKQFREVIKDHTNGMHHKMFCAWFWGTYRRKQMKYEEQYMWWIHWLNNSA